MRFFCNSIVFIRRIIIIVFIVIIIILLIIGRINSKKMRVFNEDEDKEFVIQKGAGNEKIVSFACNVDWGNEYIDSILNMLDKYDVKITFFITGRWASEYSGIAQKISSRGHEIGNNGYYNKAYDSLSYDDALSDIKKADELLRELTDYDIKLFSPPSGAYNDNVIKAAINLGYPGIVIGSIDTMDWKKTTTADDVYKNILNKIGSGDIILIHPTKSTSDALSNIIGDLLIQHYKILPISEMLKK
nr:polysaccharide deacetylase family protein [Sedimentibacter sp.]